MAQTSLLQREFGRAESKWKHDGTRVTAVDVAISEAIVRELGTRFPSDQQFSEELALTEAPIPVTAEFCWVLDPIDGTNNFALGLAWQPQKGGTIVPSISLGWGITAYSYSNQAAPAFATSNTGVSATSGISNALLYNNIAATQSWTVGLQWKDAFIKGNSAGMAVGQPVFATSLVGGDTPRDGGVVWEWWYKLQVTDNIAVTPALFYLSRPLGGDTPNGQGFNQLGGLIKTSFSF